MTVVDRFVQAVSHGGVMAKPTLIVIHSAETPLKAGYAKSIAENWFGKSATTSAHFMLDPVETIRMLSDNVVSYAVGPKANGFTLNIEQAGYARFSRAEWTTADGLKQLAKVGALIHELGSTRGIPLRWASDAQIRAAATGTLGGVCFHNDIARVLGGTTHTDPMPNYPRDLVEAAWGVPKAAPTPSPILGDDDMRVLIDNKGGLHLDSGLEVQSTGDLTLAGLWQRKYGSPVSVTQGEVGTIAADNAARRARLVSDLAKSSGVDVTGLGQTVVAGLLPQLTAALAAKTGATREDVEQVVRGVFADAAS